MFNRSFKTITLLVLVGVVTVSCGEKTFPEEVESSVSLALTWLLSESPVKQVEATLIFTDGTTVESVPDDKIVFEQLVGTHRLGESIVKESIRWYIV